MSDSHVLSLVFAAVSAGVYAYVGRELATRRVSPEAQLAAVAFSVWWFALASATLASGVVEILVLTDTLNLAGYKTFTHVNLLAIVVALWGLLYYLAYIFTGRRSVLWPITAFYVAFYVWLIYLVAWGNIVGFEVRDWGVRAVFEHEFTGSPTATVALLLLVGPHIVGAVAYFSLFFRVQDRTTRYRIGLVALSVIAWFSSSLVASLVGLSEATWWPVTSRLIGLAATLAILAAYRPPRWIRERYGIASIRQEPHGPIR